MPGTVNRQKHGNGKTQECLYLRTTPKECTGAESFGSNHY